MKYNKEKAKKSWDEIYRKEVERPEYGLEVDEDIPKITEFFKKQRVKKILDLGCGAGRTVIYLAERNFEVYGIDISKEGIEKAKQRLSERNLQAELKVYSMTARLPYSDDFFDAIVSTRTIYHATIDQIRRTIKEIKRVLKSLGLIFITVRKSNLRKKVPYAKKIAPRTFLNLSGKEKGVIHYIFNKQILKKEFRDFRILGLWVDSKGYYCLFGELKWGGEKLI